MALYELNENEVKFLQNMVTNVSFQGKIKDLENDITLGKHILISLQRPIQPTGKPKLVAPVLADIKGLTPEEQKVMNE